MNRSMLALVFALCGLLAAIAPLSVAAEHPGLEQWNSHSSHRPVFLRHSGNTDSRNRDGTLAAADGTTFLADHGAASGSWGRGALSNRQNILGCAGYMHGPARGAAAARRETIWHVRRCVLHAGLGRWVQRDPPQFEYSEGPNLNWYAACAPLKYLDSQGTSCAPTGCSASPGVAPGGGRWPPFRRPGLTPAKPPLSEYPRLGGRCGDAIEEHWSDLAASLWSQIQDECPEYAAQLMIVCDDCHDSSGVPGDGIDDLPACITPGTCGCAQPLGPGIVVCVNSDGSPVEGCDPKKTLIHELTHILQACRYGWQPWPINGPEPSPPPGWSDPYNRICREVEAYQNDGHCEDAGPPFTSVNNCLCFAACDSIGFEGDRPWSALGECVDICEDLLSGGKCTGGRCNGCP
jgi:hypothetical protein